jgi:uncharacterized membrane protein
MTETLDNPGSGEGQVEDKTVGILAYITLIGFIVALVLNQNKQGEEKRFGAFHLRQALGLIICAIGVFIVFAILSTIFMMISFSLLAIVSLLSTLIWLGFLALLIIGIINAANGTFKEVPLIGTLSSKMLGKAFE